MTLPLGLLPTTPKSKFLFDWRARDLTLSARTGQVGTLTRASTGTMFDQNGVLVTAPNNAPRFGYFGGDVGLLLEGGITQMEKWTQDLSNGYWAKSSVSVTANAGVAPDGSSTANLLTNSGIGGYVSDAGPASMACTASTYTIYGFLQKGSNNNCMTLGDIGDAAYHETSFDLNAGTFGGAHGTVVSAGMKQWGNWWFCWVTFTRTNATSINTRVACASDTSHYADAASGKMGYVWGLNCVLGSVPSSYMAATSSVNPRSADIASWPVGIAEQALTIYVKGIDVGTQLAAGAYGYASLGKWATNPALLIAPNNATNLRSYFNNGSATVNDGSLISGTSYGSGIELLMTLSASGVVQGAISVNGAGQVTAAASAAQTLGGAWGAGSFYLGGADGIAANVGFLIAQIARIAVGAQSLSYMQQG